MAGEVGALRVTLGVNSSQFEAGMRAAQRTAKQTGQNISNALKKSAEESASVFIQGDKAAKRLIASLDPLYAAQLRYNDALDEASALYKRGSLSAEEFANVQTRLKTQLDGQTQQFQRVGGVAGNLRGGMQQLSFQVGDVAQQFALGVRPMTIFAQQSGQVVQAFQLMGGGGNAFLRFLGGPWGLALATAGQLLVLFALRHKEVGESVDDLVAKMRKEADQARANEAANKIWERSYDGIIEKQRELREEIAKSIRVEVVANQQRLEDARRNQDTLRQGVAEQERELERLAQKRRDVQKELENPLLSPEQARASEVLLQRINRQFAAAEAEIKKLRNGIEQSERAIREAGIAVGRDFAAQVNDAARASNDFFDATRRRVAISVTDNQVLADSYGRIEAELQRAQEAAAAAADEGVKSIGATTRKVDELVDNLLRGKIGPESFAKSMRALADAMNAAAEAAKNAKKETSNLPRVTGQEVARALGTTITSGARTPAQNKAAGGAANSYHLSGQAIDIPLTVNGKPLTKEGIRSVLEPLGVQIKELLGPGDQGHSDHFHIAFDKRRLGSDQIAKRQDTLAKRLEAEELRGIRKENVFEERREQLNLQLLQAKADLLEDSSLEAEIAAQIVRQEQTRANLAVQNDVEEKKLTDAQATVLILKNAEIAERKLLNIEVRKVVESLREQDQVAQREHDLTVERLRFIDEMATTQAAHRQAQLDILDAVYEERRKHLERLAIQAELNGNLQDAADLYAQIAALPEQQARDRTRTLRATQGPLESFQASLPTTAEEMNEALQLVAVDGLRALEDGILSVIDGTKSLAEAFRDMASQIIAELLRIQLQRMIIGPLSNFLGGVIGSVGGGINPGVVSGLVSSGAPAGLVSAFPNIFQSGGFTGNTPPNRLAGFVHGQEYVFDAAATRRIGVGNLERIRKGLPTAANSNIRGGDTFNMPVNIHARMTPKEARETGAQLAAGFQSRVAMAKRQGF